MASTERVERADGPVTATEAVEVLFVSYYFPPLGGAGVQRSAKFVRYLPAEGFRPVVIGGPIEGRNDWSPRDDSLLEELPDGVPVYRPSAPPAGLPHYSTVSRWLLRPGPYYRWWGDSLRGIGRAAAGRHTLRLVYVSLSPFDGLAPALELGRELGLPVVADLRDPWALDEVFVYPTALHRGATRRKMGRLLARAERVIMNTPEAKLAVEEAFPALRGRVRVLTNGYDADDFAGLQPREPDGRFRIVHTGYLHTARAVTYERRSRLQRLLGGQRTEVDFYGRSPVYLLGALDEIGRRDARLLETIELHLLGVLSPRDREVIEASPISRIVKMPGYVDHARTLQAMVESDLLFLPLHGLPAGARARIVPGKTFEYLASGRPILACLPDGDAKDFVLRANAGRVVAPGDVVGIMEALYAFLVEAPAASRDLDVSVTQFERKALARGLADIFRELT